MILHKLLLKDPDRKDDEPNLELIKAEINRVLQNASFVNKESSSKNASHSESGNFVTIKDVDNTSHVMSVEDSNSKEPMQKPFSYDRFKEFFSVNDMFSKNKETTSDDKKDSEYSYHYDTVTENKTDDESHDSKSKEVDKISDMEKSFFHNSWRNDEEGREVKNVENAPQTQMVYKDDESRKDPQAKGFNYNVYKEYSYDNDKHSKDSSTDEENAKIKEKDNNEYMYHYDTSTDNKNSHEKSDDKERELDGNAKIEINEEEEEEDHGTREKEDSSEVKYFNEENIKDSMQKTYNSNHVFFSNNDQPTTNKVEDEEPKPEDRDDKVFLYHDAVVSDNNTAMEPDDDAKDDGSDSSEDMVKTFVHSNDGGEKDSNNPSKGNLNESKRYSSSNYDNYHEYEKEYDDDESSDQMSGDPESSIVKMGSDDEMPNIKSSQQKYGSQHVFNEMNNQQGIIGHYNGGVDAGDIKKQIADERNKEVLFIDPKIAKHLETVNKRRHIYRVRKHRRGGHVTKMKVKSSYHGKVVDGHSLGIISKKKYLKGRISSTRYNKRKDNMRKSYNDKKRKPNRKVLGKFGKSKPNDTNKGNYNGIESVEYLPLKGNIIQYFHKGRNENVDDFLDIKDEDDGRGKILKESHFFKPGVTEGKAMEHNAMKEYLHSIHSGLHMITDPNELQNYTVQNDKTIDSYLKAYDESIEKQHRYGDDDGKITNHKSLERPDKNNLILTLGSDDNSEKDYSDFPDGAERKGEGRKNIYDNPAKRHHNSYHHNPRKHFLHDKDSLLYDAGPETRNFKLYETYGDEEDDPTRDNHDSKSLKKHNLFLTNSHRKFHPGDDARTGNWEVFKNLIDAVKHQHPVEKERDQEFHEGADKDIEAGERNHELFHHKKRGEYDRYEKLYPSENDIIERMKKYLSEKEREERRQRLKEKNNEYDRNEEKPPNEDKSEREGHRSHESDLLESEHRHNPHKKHYKDDNDHTVDGTDDDEHPHDLHDFRHISPKVGFSFNKDFLRRFDDNDNDNDNDADSDNNNDDKDRRISKEHDSRNKDLLDEEAIANDRLLRLRSHHRRPSFLRISRHHYEEDPAYRDYEKAWLIHSGVPYNLSGKYTGREGTHDAYNITGKNVADHVLSIPRHDELYAHDELHFPRHDELNFPRHDELSVPHHDELSVPRHDELSVPRHDELNVPPHDELNVPRHDGLEVPEHHGKDYYNSLPLGYYGPLDEDTNTSPAEKGSDTNPVYLYGKGLMNLPSAQSNPNEKLPELNSNFPNDDHPAHYLFRKLARQGQMGDANYEHSLDDQAKHNSLQDISLTNELTSSLPNQPPLTNDISVSANPDVLKNHRVPQDDSVVGSAPNDHLDNVLSFHHLDRDKSARDDSSNLPDPLSQHHLKETLENNIPSISINSLSDNHLVQESKLQTNELTDKGNESPVKNISADTNASSKDELHIVNPLDYDIPRFPQRSNSEGVNQFFDHEIQRISQHVNQLPVVADKFTVHPTVLEDLLATFANISKAEITTKANVNNDKASDTDTRLTSAQPEVPPPEITPQDMSTSNLVQPQNFIPSDQLSGWNIVDNAVSSPLTSNIPLDSHANSLVSPQANQISAPQDTGKSEVKIPLNPQQQSLFVLIPYGATSNKEPQNVNEPASNQVTSILNKEPQNLKEPFSIQVTQIPPVINDTHEHTPEECNSYQAITTEGLGMKQPEVPMNPQPPLPPKYGLSPYQILTSEESQHLKPPLSPDTKMNPSINPETYETAPNACKCQILTSDCADGKGTTIPQPPLPPKYGLSPYQVLTTEGSHCMQPPNSGQSASFPSTVALPWGPTSSEFKLFQMFTDSAKMNNNDINSIPSIVTVPWTPSTSECKSYQVLTSEGARDKEEGTSSIPNPPLPPAVGLSPYQVLTSEGSQCAKIPDNGPSSSRVGEESPELCKSYQILTTPNSDGKDSPVLSRPQSSSPASAGFSSYQPFQLVNSDGTHSILFQPIDKQAFQKACESYKILASQGSNSQKDEGESQSGTTPDTLNSHYPSFPKPDIQSFISPFISKLPWHQPISSKNSDGSPSTFFPPIDKQALKACELYKILESKGRNAQNEDNSHLHGTTSDKFDSHDSSQPKPPLPPMFGISPYQVLTSESSHHDNPSSVADGKPSELKGSESPHDKDSYTAASAHPQFSFPYPSYRPVNYDGTQTNFFQPIDKQSFQKACEAYKILASLGSISQDHNDGSHSGITPETINSHYPSFQRPDISSLNTDINQPSSHKSGEVTECSPLSIGPEPPLCEKPDNLPPCSPLSIGPEPPLCQKGDDLPPYSPLSIGPEPQYHPKQDDLPPCSPLSIGPEPHGCSKTAEGVPLTFTGSRPYMQYEMQHYPSWFRLMLPYGSNHNPCFKGCGRSTQQISNGTDVIPPCAPSANISDSNESIQKDNKTINDHSATDDLKKDNESKLANDIENILKHDNLTSFSSPSNKGSDDTIKSSSNPRLNLIKAIDQLKRKSLVNQFHRSRILRRPFLRPGRKNIRNRKRKVSVKEY